MSQRPTVGPGATHDYVPGNKPGWLAWLEAGEPTEAGAGLGHGDSHRTRSCSSPSARHRQRGINNRDIKPANLMLGPAGTVKITDVGLAYLGGRTRITKTVRILGTPSYMAPEQLRGEQTDSRADIWSFGVVLHEMIASWSPDGQWVAVGGDEGQGGPVFKVSIAGEPPPG